MNFLYSIDEIILGKFQEIAQWVSVKIAVNVLVLASVVIHLSTSRIMAAASVSIVIVVAASVWCLNVYSQQEEGFKNELSESLIFCRMVVLGFIGIQIIALNTDWLFLADVLEFFAIYLVSTDKQPKPPKIGEAKKAIA